MKRPDPETATRPPTDRRECPRFSVDAQLFASIDGRTVRLRDISRSGVAIYGSGLVPGSAHLLEVHLNRQHVTAAIEILDRSEDRLLHARFTGLSTAALHLIDAYIADRH